MAGKPLAQTSKRSNPLRICPAALQLHWYGQAHSKGPATAHGSYPCGAGKNIAQHRVRQEGSRLPGFGGAYLVGSVTTFADGVALPATSDVDIAVVSDCAPSPRLGKFVYRHLLLDVSFVAWKQVRSHESVHGHSQMAAGFRAWNILADPSDHLTRIQEKVAKQFSNRYWVRRRVRHAGDMALDRLQAVEGLSAWHDQITSWLFGASLTTLILAKAGLMPPTVRRRYAVARELLAVHGKLEFYEQLLQLLGCASWCRSRTPRHLDAAAAAFDEAKRLLKAGYRFASDISDVARPVALEGSKDLIEQGLHREAVFWIVATYARCRWIFHRSASSYTRDRYDLGFQRMLRDLGIHTFADLKARSAQVRRFLPRLMETAEGIMAATPGIQD